MKKLLFLLAVFSLSLAAAQEAPEGMVLIEYNHQEDLQAQAERMATLKEEGYRQVYSEGKTTAVDHIQTNHPTLDKFKYQFLQGAKHYYIDYEKELSRLQRVIYVNADPYFLGEVSKDKTTIYLNAQLLKYKNLNWVVFHTQMGELFGLKRTNKGHSFMSRHWEIDQEHEDIAKKRRSFGYDREEFFKELNRKNGLTIRI